MIGSYSNQRTQRTKINNSVSEAIDVIFGVPQGTVLGVLLILTYINDIHNGVMLSEILLFADDGLLYGIGDTVEECVAKVNSDLKNIDEWLKMNKMKLNIDKTKALCINGSLNNSYIFINNV